MPLPSLLLRLLLMISLVLNGLNIAVAAPMAARVAAAAEVHAADHRPVQPPCHDAAPVVHGSAQAHGGLESAAADHCQIKDCLRSCAQQPALVLGIALLPAGPYGTVVPQGAHGPDRPSPALPQISRPPIA
ncbi:CopL family metal-binding regulatory protein [Stenotrophomonas sp. C3(2023)]|uniref:CopL family metal-binding regulatory protein n=1 Tax=Stenotrophomonas sp. C3(2023) TaxID=3080277 RepID=UPI00293CC61B|nr:CopL family metal-binding regulatory protein [Stenotrophomonas sp. C3(2023)]MDV3467855.1 CopL family metal-binding regulatory protein [Stenotrophomonas sp. C3(2023)]